MWICLMPREVSILNSARAKGENQAVLDALRRNLDPLRGDLEIPSDLLPRVKHAAACWRDGGEKAFLAVLEGVARHAGDRV